MPYPIVWRNGTSAGLSASVRAVANANGANAPSIIVPVIASSAAITHWRLWRRIGNEKDKLFETGNKANKQIKIGFIDIFYLIFFGLKMMAKLCR